tara:strand:- start:1484 stop:2401 length:918 start_codon:yes stop_codon:yes gene_type:complete
MKIGFLGVKTASIDLINLLNINNIKINYIITLKKINKKINVADKGNLIQFAKKNKIKICKIEKYTISKNDVSKIKELNLDLCIVFGWQRIIPDNALNLTKFGFYGFHGSYLKLPNGRGRSPFNWTLRKNKKKIYYNLFKYSKDYDLGDIFETSIIKINTNEDIQVVIKKSLLEAAEMIINLINDINKKNLKLRKQKLIKNPIDFKKITPESCKIDFTKSIKYNLAIILASAKPFDGAYAIYNRNKKIFIYEAYDLNIKINKIKKAGLVYLPMQDNSFFLCFFDGILFVKSHSLKDIEKLKIKYLK